MERYLRGEWSDERNRRAEGPCTQGIAHDKLGRALITLMCVDMA
jgi:hypothetical protein